MSGCYGGGKEDRHFESMLHKYLSKDDDKEQKVVSIYQDKINNLNSVVAHRRQDGSINFHFSVLQDTFNDISDEKSFVPLAKAIQSGKVEEVGNLVIKMIKAELLKQAEKKV